MLKNPYFLISFFLISSNFFATAFDSSSSVKDKCVLILGAGQIGEACAVRIIKEQPETIILHTLTEKEASLAIDNVKKAIDSDTNTKIVPSWGDVLVPNELIFMSKKDLSTDPHKKDLLLNFYYSPLTDELLRNSSLYKILEKHNPHIIVDSINMATVVGYEDDPYSFPRKIIKKTDKDIPDMNWKAACKHLLSSSIVPALIRFTQALQKGMADFNIESYVKVSTTGLGGMGVNLFYTHGDLDEPGMSSGILGKVAAAGVIHQLFWSLGHTPGTNIKVIAPAALVGWQPVNFGKFRSHGKNLPLIDNKNKVKLKIGNTLETYKGELIEEYMKIPFVDSGENSAYSSGEMTAITALGQMECITKEEVAQAVFESIKGSTKYDLLTAMDYVAMGPSFSAAMQRSIILENLKKIEKEKGIPSIATNNLGPTVSKNLFELHILFEVSDKSIEKILNTDTDSLAQKIENFINEKNNLIRQQSLSLGLPIILGNNELIMGEYFLVPNMEEENTITEENINKWANQGWIDLRKSRLDYWKHWLQAIISDSLKIKKSNITVLERNWYKVQSGDIGEILGYLYSIQGGNRRKQF